MLIGPTFGALTGVAVKWRAVFGGLRYGVSRAGGRSCRSWPGGRCADAARMRRRYRYRRRQRRAGGRDEPSRRGCGGSNLGLGRRDRGLYASEERTGIRSHDRTQPGGPGRLNLGLELLACRSDQLFGVVHRFGHLEFGRINPGFDDFGRATGLAVAVGAVGQGRRARREQLLQRRNEFAGALGQHCRDVSLCAFFAAEAHCEVHAGFGEGAPRAFRLLRPQVAQDQ